ncbi:MAG: hypothetical protein ABEN55_20835 [Bradymonadaceae bacterium]
MNYTAGSHKWDNSLTINEGFARTPSLDQFVKNTDTLAAETLYQYYFLPWSGIFGESTVETTVFTTNNVTAEPSNYLVTRADGTEQTFSNTTQLQLGGPLEPTAFSESAGFFVKPVRETPFTLMVRTGIGARETFADGVLAVKDNPETDPIEVSELSNVYQGGLEAFVGAEGAFPERKISYKIGAHGLLPVINNDDENRSSVQLFRYGVNGEVTFDAFDWLSISYNAKVLRDPQLIEETQVQNNLLLNVKYSIIEPREPEKKAEEPSAEEKLEKMRQRVEELEKQVEEKDKDKATAEGAESAEENSEKSGDERGTDGEE